MLRALLSLGVMLAIGCAEEGADDASCETLCGVLVGQCEFAAYPSSDSCTQGCIYNQAKGADVDALLACVEAAESCDPFAIAECEHAHGS